MLTEEQRRALNDILQDYWQETDANDIIDDVLQIVDPIEAAKYLEEHAASTEQLASKTPEAEEGSLIDEKYYYLNEARKFRDVAKLLRKGG